MTKSTDPDGSPTLVAQEARLAELESRIGEISARLPSMAVESQATLQDMLIEQQNERILELQRLVGNLGERISSAQVVGARDEQFNQAVRSVDAAALAVQRSLSPPGTPVPPLDVGWREKPATSADCGCHDGQCGCVSCDCCTFEVWMTHVRVDHMQIEPLDSNAFPINEIEMWMFASIDPLYNIGVCIPDPGPASYLALHKQVTDPYGPWVSINRCVGTAMVKKGFPLTIPLTLTAVEREPDRVMGDRDEWGVATENLTLDCCYASYSPIVIPVALSAWGQGGGAISGKFMVVKKC